MALVLTIIVCYNIIVNRSGIITKSEENSVEKRLLTDEEVLALDKILIEGNNQIVALNIASIYYGRGGSNSSPPTTEYDVNKPLDDFNGKAPVLEFGLYLRAVVNDVVYLATTNRSAGKVISFDAQGEFSIDYDGAYDTVRCGYIVPVLKK